MPLASIGKFTLKHQGGYVARMRCVYLDDEGNKVYTGQTGDVLLGQTQTCDPGDLGVPDGSLTYFSIVVVAGYDHDASRAFTYQKGNTSVANYSCAGTTLDNSLALIDIT